MKNSRWSSRFCREVENTHNKHVYQQGKRRWKEHKVFTAASERTIKVKSGHHPHHHPCINIHHLGQQQGKFSESKKK